MPGMQPMMPYRQPGFFDPFARPDMFEPEGAHDLHPTFPGAPNQRFPA